MTCVTLYIIVTIVVIIIIVFVFAFETQFHSVAQITLAIPKYAEQACLEHIVILLY